MGEADRAGVHVRLIAERQRATAEHLRTRRQLDVDLQPDDRLIAVGNAHPLTSGGLVSKAMARSSAWAASRRRDSPNAGAAIWKPTGSSGPPSSGAARPAGIEIAGNPARGIRPGQKADIYIARGSAGSAPAP